MSKTVYIKYHSKLPPGEFLVGQFVTLGNPYRSKRLLPQQLVCWINEMAEKGLIFHSEYDNNFIFRVDGAVIEQLKESLSLSGTTSSEYTGGDPPYEQCTTLTLYLDEEPIGSEISLP